METTSDQLQREISERRKAEERLAEANRILEQERNMFINGPVAVFKWQNKEGWPVEYVSPNIEQISGYSREEFMSGEIAYAALIPQADIGRVTEEVVAFGASGVSEFQHEPYRLKRKDGREIWIADYTTILRNDDGEITHYLGYVIDSTDRQLAAEVLRRANEDLEQRVMERTAELVEAKEAAESANRAKSEFLANMSHELRTPLNAILGYAQILKRGSHSKEHVDQSLDIIHRSGHHLLTLINDVLDLSKIEARKMVLHPAEFRFSPFLDGVSEIIKIRSEQKGVDYHFERSADLPKGVSADEKRLRQVLINLLSNAVKFTERGRVTFRVFTPEGESDAEGAEIPGQVRLRFEVTDTGVGMSAEEVAKIFLPFEQVGHDRRRTEGTGLGLSISHSLVETMEGQLHVESEPDKGSRFWFDIHLPTAEVSDDEIPARERTLTGYEGRRRKVLIVDDKLFNRMVLSDFFQPLGFEVLEADDGQKGIELAIEAKPDIVFMDLVMPVMTGFEATKQIREQSELASMIIIATSASVFNDDQEHSLVAGCDAFLPKPIDIEKLIDIVEEKLGLVWITKPGDTPADSSTASAGEVVPPSAEVLGELLDLAMRGDMLRLEERAKELEKTAEDMRPFAHKLRKLVKGFEDDKIIELLESFA